MENLLVGISSNTYYLRERGEDLLGLDSSSHGLASFLNKDKLQHKIMRKWPKLRIVFLLLNIIIY